MSIIVRLKQMLRMHKGNYEVWDTSAISNWLEVFKSKIESGKTTIILHEGVVHELSVGRRNHEICRKAYEYVISLKSDMILKIATRDATRSWTIDEQVVDAVAEYYKKGYNVTLVTCDKDQAYKAEIKGLKCRYLIVKKDDVIQKPEIDKLEKTLKKDEPKEVKEIKKTVAAPILEIPCIKLNKINYIDVKHRITVFDNRGKRKIGKNELIPILFSDTFEYMNHRYAIQALTDTSITFKRVDRG